jgi:hypothetical protein
MSKKGWILLLKSGIKHQTIRGHSKKDIMHNRMLPVGKTAFLFSVVFCLLTAMSIWQSRAATYTLSDANSSVIFDSASGNLSSWSVDGQNQLAVQNFWYRIGAGNSVALSTLGTTTVTPIDASSLKVTYASAQVSVSVSYFLTGTQTGNGQSDIYESIKMSSLAGPLNFHLFQFSDFNLQGTPGGDAAYMNTDAGSGLISGVNQSKGTVTYTVAATGIGPYANLGQVDASSPGTLPVAGTANGLNGVIGQPSAITGPNVSWSLQWDFPNLNQQLISEDNFLNTTLVPEPSILAFITLGLVGFALRKRNQLNG